MSESECRTCGSLVEGDIPKGYIEVFVCDICGRYWDENGNVEIEGEFPQQPDFMSIAHSKRED